MCSDPINSTLFLHRGISIISSLSLSEKYLLIFFEVLSSSSPSPRLYCLTIDKCVKRRWDPIRSELVGRMLVNDFTSRYARTERGQRRYCIIICRVHPCGGRVSEGVVCEPPFSSRIHTHGRQQRIRVMRCFVCGSRRSVSVITYQINYSYYFIPPRRFRTSCRAEPARYSCNFAAWAKSAAS